MNKQRLEKHVKLCLKNLKDVRVKCCATCPFEEEITAYKADFKDLFIDKRRHFGIHDDYASY